VLRHPDFTKKFILQTDASGYGLGAVLSQIFEDGEHPIAYASRTLEDRETRHAVIEKEALAICWGIHHFRHYLTGKKFMVQTDHQPLIALRRIKDLNMRLQKISLKLQGYQFDIEYRPGIKNQNADLLSRYPMLPLKRKGTDVAPSDSATPLAQVLCNYGGYGKMPGWDGKIMWWCKACEDISRSKPSHPRCGNCDTVKREFTGVKLWWCNRCEDFSSNAYEEPLCDGCGARKRRRTDAPPDLEQDNEWRKSMGLGTHGQEFRENYTNPAIWPIPDHLRTENIADAEQRRDTDIDHNEELRVQMLAEEPPPISLTDASRQWRKLPAMLRVDPWFGPMMRFLDSLQADDMAKAILPDDRKLARQILLCSDQYLLEEGRLFRITGARIQLCIPAALRPVVLFQCHDSIFAGHLGTKKTFQRLLSRYFWPGYAKAINEYVAKCPQCILFKKQARTPKETLGRKDVPHRVWQTVHMDIWEPGKNSPKTARGKKYVLAFVDAYSKFVIAFTMPNKKARSVAQVITHQLLPTLGPPCQLICDNAKEFRGHVATELFRLADITTKFIAPHNPRSNGQVERFFRPFRAILASITQGNSRDWDLYVPHAVFAYNTSYHRTIQNTPYFLMYGRDLELLLHEGVMDPRREDYLPLTRWLERVTTARKAVRQYIQGAATRNKTNYDVRARPQKFKLGDAVILDRDPDPNSPQPRKFQPCGVGPFRITEIGDRVAVLRPIASSHLQEVTSHFDRMRLCDETRFIVPPDFEEHEIPERLATELDYDLLPPDQEVEQDYFDESMEVQPPSPRYFLRPRAPKPLPAVLQVDLPGQNTTVNQDSLPLETTV
jgi:transposase InsO family protein